METHMFQAFLEDRMRVALGGLAGIKDWAARGGAGSEAHADDGLPGGGPDNESELLSRCGEGAGMRGCGVHVGVGFGGSWDELGRPVDERA